MHVHISIQKHLIEQGNFYQKPCLKSRKDSFQKIMNHIQDHYGY